MKKLLFFIVFICIEHSIFSQNCGSSTSNSRPNTSSPSTSTLWVNVYYHIVQTSVGTNGIPENYICKATTDANNIFNKYGIYVNTVGYDYVPNSTLFDFNTVSSSTIFSTQGQSNAINVYIVNSITDNVAGSVGGCSQNIPAVALVITKSSIINSPSILTHEMGHCFGLFHTHRGTPLYPSREFIDDANVEHINGDNSLTSGDFISDTPADPGLPGRSNSCVYTGTDIRDGALFSPDTRNIMSYAGELCRDRFSPLQVNAMMNTLLLNPNFVGIRNTNLPIPSINASNTVCSNNLFTVSNLRLGFSPFWSSSNSSVAYVNSIFNQSWAYITRSQNSNGYATITTTISDGCQSYNISKKVTVGTPQLEGTYTYGYNTYAVSNPSTGIAVSGSTPTIYINIPSSDPNNFGYLWNTTSSGGNSSFSSNGSNASIYLSGGAYRNVTCNAYNSCGLSPQISFNCYNYSYYRLVASPNPTSQNLTLNATLVADNAIPNPNETFLRTKNIHTTPVKLMDRNNRMVATGLLNNGIFTCSLSNVPNGTYFLQIAEGENLMTKQIIVQH
jgi:hypothetical protein